MIEVIEYKIGNVVEIEAKTWVWKMGKVMSSNFENLFTYIDDNYEKNEDMIVYARYVGLKAEKEVSKSKFTMIMDMLFRKWHFFNGVVTKEMMKDLEEIKAGEYNERQYLKAIHLGPYQEVGAVYKEMVDYAKEHHLRLEDEAIEFYMNDPKDVPKEEIETVILIPLRKA